MAVKPCSLAQTCLPVGQDAGFNPARHSPRPFAAFFCLLNKPADQDTLAQLLADGKLKLPIDEEFPFTREGVVGVLKKQAGKKSLGKNVVKIAA